MRLMFIADITGRPGRWVVSQLLWGFKRKYEIDFVIANVENAAGGYGITREMSRSAGTRFGASSWILAMDLFALSPA